MVWAVYGSGDTFRQIFSKARPDWPVCFDGCGAGSYSGWDYYGIEWTYDVPYQQYCRLEKLAHNPGHGVSGLPDDYEQARKEDRKWKRFIRKRNRWCPHGNPSTAYDADISLVYTGLLGSREWRISGNPFNRTCMVCWNCYSRDDCKKYRAWNGCGIGRIVCVFHWNGICSFSYGIDYFYYGSALPGKNSRISDKGIPAGTKKR